MRTTSIITVLTTMLLTLSVACAGAGNEAMESKMSQQQSEIEALKDEVATLDQRVSEQEAHTETEAAAMSKMEEMMDRMSNMESGPGAMGDMGMSTGPPRFDRETATQEQRTLVEETLVCAKELIEIRKDMPTEDPQRETENIENDIWQAAGRTQADEQLMQMQTMTCSQRDHLKAQQ